MMYPFLVLDLPQDTTNQKVAARYQELVSRYPPDRAPETFTVIRQAYEAVKDKRARLKTRLFDFDGKQSSMGHDALPRVVTEPRRRLAATELSALLRGVDLRELEG